MSKQVEIEALRAFNKTPQGDICEPGDVFAIDPTRADELERLGLAKRTDGAKAKAEPENKAAPKPSNKAITSKSVKLSGEG